MNLESKFELLCRTPSDIHEHLPTLRSYASECDHVTEAGVRYVVSTFALMMGKPRRLVSIDIVHPNDMVGGPKDVIKGKDEFALATSFAHENGVDFEFVLGSTLTIDLEPTDLLFLDTLHQYNQLSAELERHSEKVRKYILLHDTQSFRYRDEGDMATNQTDKKGLQLAITEFLESHCEWELHKEYTNNNGLTVLKRKDTTVN
jgi:hypothetical protein